MEPQPGEDGDVAGWKTPIVKDEKYINDNYIKKVAEKINHKKNAKKSNSIKNRKYNRTNNHSSSNFAEEIG